MHLDYEETWEVLFVHAKTFTNNHFLSILKIPFVRLVYQTAIDVCDLRNPTYLIDP